MRREDKRRRGSNEKWKAPDFSRKLEIMEDSRRGSRQPLTPTHPISFRGNLMIVQDLGDRIRCIDQHDHAILSGVFASAWVGAQEKSPASSELIVATSLHDMCWIDADISPRFDPHSGRPWDFLAYPEAPKLALYLRGIAAMERLHPYGALLHALHFSSFADPKRQPAFHQEIGAIVARCSERCSREGHRLDRVTRDLELLRIFDVLSLLLCMTGPEIERAPPPWLAPSPLLQREGLTTRWERGDFVIDPFPFDAPFDVSIVYREVATHVDGSVDAGELAAAPRQAQRVRVRPAN